MPDATIRLNEYPVKDPQAEFYDLSLQERFAKYVAMISSLRDLRKRALGYFAEKDTCPSEVWRPHCVPCSYDSSAPPAHQKGGLTLEELRDELREIIPTFNGVVLDRKMPPSWALHYIIRPEDMHALFGHSIFGVRTGKVVGDSDNLLGPYYRDLSGRVILQAKQPSVERDRWVMDHELYHSQFFHYPNGIKRDNLVATYNNISDMTPIADTVEILIGLDRAILIDEAGACLSCYCDSLPDRDQRFKTEFIEELKNVSRNFVGVMLDRGRQSGLLGAANVQRVNDYEEASRRFPFRIRQATLNLAENLANPERLAPIGYALSYVLEALRVLNFLEIMNGDLETFCLEFMEPRRQGRGIMRV